MKLYNERTTKDFLWITVLYSGKVNWWPRSINLSTTRTGGNKWCRHAEAFAFYEINLHLDMTSVWRHERDGWRTRSRRPEVARRRRKCDVGLSRTTGVDLAGRFREPAHVTVVSQPNDVIGTRMITLSQDTFLRTVYSHSDLWKACDI